jgi:hypothetical protein
MELSGNGVTPNTFYGAVVGSWPPTAGGGPESSVQSASPTTGTITNLQVTVSGTAGTGGVSFTLRDGGASESLTCTITAPALSCSDLIHVVPVNQGDLLDFKIVADTLYGSSSPVNVLVSYQF